MAASHSATAGRGRHRRAADVEDRGVRWPSTYRWWHGWAEPKAQPLPNEKRRGHRDARLGRVRCANGQQQAWCRTSGHAPTGCFGRAEGQRGWPRRQCNGCSFGSPLGPIRGHNRPGYPVKLPKGPDVLRGRGRAPKDGRRANLRPHPRKI